MNKQTGDKFVRLVEIMARLRKNCPWDAEQTPESLRQYIIEEAYEVVHAIELGDLDELREELGDLMLQVVFQSEIAGERGQFEIGDVIDTLCEKLVRRHPHVFGEVEVSGSGEVLKNWEQIKREEKQGSARLESLPRMLPALLRAARMISKCQRAHLDLAPEEEIRAELPDLVSRLMQTPPDAPKETIERSIARALFMLGGFAQEQGVNPEDVLRNFEDRIVDRLHRREEELVAEGRSLEELTPEEKHRLAQDLLG